MRITYIAWIGYHRRADLIAQHLGATAHYISSGRQGDLRQAPQRYLRQSRETWQVLCQERPDVIFVQNPPIFAVLVAFFYARRYAARYAIDSHSGAFIGWKWRWSLPLHRLLSRQAVVTIVHNKSQAALVSDWGCRHSVIGFTPGDYPMGASLQLPGQFNVAVVASFIGDEPIDVVFEAALRSPEVRFYVTGDSRRMPAALAAKKPENCFLTGYLPYDQYVDLLRAVDAIMVLTTRDNTLLMGGFEAVSLGIPLITSDWPILRDYFPLGTVHVANTVEGICEGLCLARLKQTMLRQEMLALQERLQAEWEQQLADLQRLIQEPMEGDKAVSFAQAAISAPVLRLQEFLDNALRTRSALRVLEAGCGSASRFGFPGKQVHVTGIDISHRQLERNRDLDTRIEADIQTYSFQPGSYDVIICWWVLEHLARPDLALRGFASALSKEGLIVLAVPNVLSVKGLLAKYVPFPVQVWMHRRLHGPQTNDQENVGPFRAYLRYSTRPKALRQFADRNGLQILYYATSDSLGPHWYSKGGKFAKVLRTIYGGLNKLVKVATLGLLGENDFFMVLQKRVD